MKKILLLLFILSYTASPVFCESEDFGWYCKHVSDHKVPSAPSEMSFIDEYNAIYVDKSHSSYADSEKVIYLTFDAGYENGNISKILDILKEEEVTGAFFILAYLIRKNPDLVKRMSDEGHLVSNHTMNHKDMSKMSDKDLADELTGLEDLYRERIGGELAKFYRPPEGRFSRENLKVASDLGYTTVFWSFAYNDWNNDRQPDRADALRKIYTNIHNGEIMLLHPTSNTNASILRELIQHLKEEGFRFGCLNEIK